MYCERPPPFVQLDKVAILHRSALQRHNFIELSLAAMPPLRCSSGEAVRLPQHGNGLGLSLVTLIVDRIGGWVGSDRTADSGATIILQLPIAARS
jgi:hypothetical protein